MSASRSSLAKHLNLNSLKLNHKFHQLTFEARPNTSGKYQNVILMHGMLSSSSAAFSIPYFTQPMCAVLRNRLQCDINCYLLDARNHGTSPHSNDFSLLHSVIDLDQFIIDQNIRNPLLIGHSLGGKTALLYALMNRSDFNCDIFGIVSFDASPSTYDHNHQKFLHAMKSIDIENNTDIKKKFDVDKQLKNVGIDIAMDRAFAMESLLHNVNETNTTFKWQCNLDSIIENEHSIHSFPCASDFSEYSELKMEPFLKNVLFVGGTQSTRLTEERYLKDVKYWFPNHTLCMHNGEHFIHKSHVVDVIKDIAQYCQTLT